MNGNLTVINVTDPPYNADNSGATDASHPINLALANVPTGSSPNVAQGAIVYFPPGTYLINNTLVAKTPFTRCVGAGKDATVILMNKASWPGIPSPADPNGSSYMLDFLAYGATDSTIEDMTINGAAGNLGQTDPTKSKLYSGVLCSARNFIERVSIYDVWGYGLWIFGSAAEWTTLVDCDADAGSNPNAHSPGNDTIGGGGVRTKIVRFYWKPTLDKNSALYFTAPGALTLAETSVDIIDCNNESPLEVVLEGCYQSSVRGSRFYSSNLRVKSDASTPHDMITNPMDILVADNLFVGQQNTESQYVGGSCIVELDGGIYCIKPLLNPGGRIAILGNTFIDSAGPDPTVAESAIHWAGDDRLNSQGGSIIANNRIINPNANGITGKNTIPGGCPGANLGSAWGCGIAVLSSAGLTIARNTINDARGFMQYAIQLFSSTDLALGASMGSIVVEGNLCGNAPGYGNGVRGTFYPNPNPTALLPLPILRGNTNQFIGYDANATAELASSNGTPWPGPGGYPYDALICLGGLIESVQIGGVTCPGPTVGTFYLPAGQTITVTWTEAPAMAVFSC